ncbi:hypothetical protein P755_gp111 [Mycobacterium phage Quink]|uniref:Uncharacterized protein n=8 Tax=Viruses TaxID=10239 RepID=Q857M0_9CAUD|nr:gp144 [Mycobacterium phage Cjw1]YP_002014467.1 hypothetical protein Porky_148 [Mycobacterium phage Porky]YP_008409537.1 hypothetical protein DRDREY_146 [Mycobacterium phage DrDrey]YP_008531226.1 hypothetical protein P755_gp111 [Mycobacterium phage Quink]YP_008859577.1 hypothetical protein BRUIN_142 [Mycobacterium phage Bruin]YP_009197806.1 hypothetical protein SEA_NELITZAMV_140 [Mycobacterium phage NelitzaMV]AEK08988.1 hypothetical protein PBI_HENRY_145 [Mycobacterium phage Henry]AEL21867
MTQPSPNQPVVALTADQKRTVVQSIALRFLDRAGIAYRVEDTDHGLTVDIRLEDSPQADDIHGQHLRSAQRAS